MQTEAGHNKIPDDEIDIGSIGAKVYSIIAYPFSLLASHIKTTLAFIVVAVLFSVSLKYIIPKTYESSFIIRPTDIKDKLHLKVLQDIPVLLKKVNADLLAGELSLSTEEAGKIRNITISNSSSGKTMMDSLNCTEITISTTDYNLFIPVQNGIISLLENNPYFLKVKKLQQQQIANSLNQVENDISQLDSLKKVQLKNYDKQPVTGQSALMLNELSNPTTAYVLGLERIEKKNSLMAQTAFLDRFQLIKSCVVTKQPSYPPRILVTLLYTIPVFLILCFFFLVIKELVRSKK